jgi:hypothetical protein
LKCSVYRDNDLGDTTVKIWLLRNEAKDLKITTRSLRTDWPYLKVFGGEWRVRPDGVHVKNYLREQKQKNAACIGRDEHTTRLRQKSESGTLGSSRYKSRLTEIGKMHEKLTNIHRCNGTAELQHDKKLEYEFRRINGDDRLWRRPVHWDDWKGLHPPFSGMDDEGTRRSSIIMKPWELTEGCHPLLLMLQAVHWREFILQWWFAKRSSFVR